MQIKHLHGSIYEKQQIKQFLKLKYANWIKKMLVKCLVELALIRLMQPELSRVKAKKFIYLKCG